MANLTFDISGIRAIVDKAKEYVKTEHVAGRALALMGMEYMREAKEKTPHRGGQEYEVTEKAYGSINAYEVTAKGYKAARARNRGGRTKQLKRVVSGKAGKRFLVLTASEHMRRSWQMGTITKKGKTFTLPVLNTASYASFVNDGHRQTPGRYVPSIPIIENGEIIGYGARLKKPFVPGLDITGKAEAAVRRKERKCIEQAVNESMQVFK